MSTEQLKQRRDQLFGEGSTLFYQEPVHIVRGEGVRLFDADGRSYMDLYNNVPCVGHANPHVVEAMHQQAATLNVHSRYLHEGILDYAERLLEKHHDGIESVVFSCTGTEANEIAIMMARLATGGRGIICTNAAYHGNSAEVRKLTHTQNSSHGTEIRSFPFPQKYRPGINSESEVALTQHHLDELQQTIDSLAADGIPLAGMLICPIFANEGLPDVPAGFMSAAAEKIRQAGGLVIADEVQAGLCRSGEWWGHELMGFQPDIVSMGKPLGNGYPLAATAASRSVVEGFRKTTRYFNTFASSPLQAAAGSAVLDVIEQQQLQPQVAKVGTYLRQQLTDLIKPFEQAAEVRGCGLFAGVEWVKDRTSKEPDPAGAAALANQLKEKGFLLSNAGAHRNVIKIRPPLVFQQSDADEFLSAFEETLRANHVL